MKILVVSNLYPPHYQGGYEVRCAQVSEALSRSGHEVWVLTSRHGLPVDRLGNAKRRTEQLDGVRVHRWLGQHSFPPQPVLQRPWTPLTAKRRLADVRSFIRLVEDFRPDVVSWWSMYGLETAMLPLPPAWGIPDVHWVEHWWMIRNHGPHGEIPSAFWTSVWEGEWGPARLRPLFRALGRRWEQRVARQGIPTREFPNRPSHVCFVSEYMRRLHREAGICFESSEVIHGGVPLGPFYQPLEERGAGSGELRLLYAGQLSEDRGLHTVVEALGRLDPATRSRLTLSVAGGGRSTPYEERVRKLVSDLELAERVSFLGRVPHDAMGRTYKEHDVLVFPSMRDEGLPLTMVEAMLAGCAVVTTGSGGAEEVAAAADLPRFPKGDAEALSRLLVRLVEHPEEVSLRASTGQRVARSEFSFEHMMERWSATLERLVAEAPRRRTEAPR